MSEELSLSQREREGRKFSFLNMFSFLMPLLEVIKIIIASVASVVFLGFACLTLAGSTMALALRTPLFIIFSPVLIPATIATAVLTTGFTAGGSFAGTAVSLIIWLIKRRMGAKPKDNPPPAGLPPTPGVGNASDQTMVKKPKPKGESKLPEFVKKIPGVESIFGGGKGKSDCKGHKVGGRKGKSKSKGGMSRSEGGMSGSEGGMSGDGMSGGSMSGGGGHRSRGLRGKGSKRGMSGSEGSKSGDGGMSGGGGRKQGGKHGGRGMPRSRGCHVEEE